MALKALVMSPLHNMGSSVVATLMAHGATFANKSALLMFSDTQSKVPDYLGIENIDDPTRSVMQIVRLIDNGAIDDKDILDYTFSFAQNAFLLNTADRSLQNRDRNQIIKHVFGRATSDVVIMDNSDDLISPFTSNLIDISDAIFLVIEPSPKAFERFKQWKTHRLLAERTNVYVIVNCYNEVIYSVRDLAKHIGMPASRVCKLHYNPWIAKCCINHQLHTILPLAMSLDPRVVNISNDIREFNSCIESELYVNKGR